MIKLLNLAWWAEWLKINAGLALVLLCLAGAARAEDPIPLALNAGVRAFDAAQTCYNLDHGWHERFIPTQSCAGISAWIAGSQGLQMFSDWQLRRHGHTKSAFVVRWLGPLPNAIAIGYSFTHPPTWSPTYGPQTAHKRKF